MVQISSRFRGGVDFQIQVLTHDMQPHIFWPAYEGVTTNELVMSNNFGGVDFAK
jgi:hypothetical protein